MAHERPAPGAQLGERQVGQCRPNFFKNGGDHLFAKFAASETLRDQLVVRGFLLPRWLARCPVRSGRKRRRGYGDAGWCRPGHWYGIVDMSTCWLVGLKVVCLIVVTWEAESVR